MFERFTDRARKAMALANQEAQRFNHKYIGTEHILLGLAKEGTGLAAMVLKGFDVDLRKVRLEIEKLVRSGPDMVPMGKLPVTPEAKQVVDFAIEEADKLKDSSVDTEHVLLGLIRQNESVAVQALANLGLQADEVRRQVLAIVNDAPVAPPFLYSEPWDRFTDHFRRVMSLANQEAKRLNHEYVGTEHFLLGILKADTGVAANVQKARDEVEKLVRPRPDKELPDKLPQTPRAKKAIEYAFEEARTLGHCYVGTEHLLLGLIREHDGVAAHVLVSLGLELDQVRQEVLDILGNGVGG